VLARRNGDGARFEYRLARAIEQRRTTPVVRHRTRRASRAGLLARDLESALRALAVGKQPQWLAATAAG
jgi:hypothetical protein